MEGSREWFNKQPGTDGIYHYIEELRRGESSFRVRAAIALGESHDPRAVRPLVEFSGDADAELRRTVVEALCKLESVRSVSALTDRLRDPNEDWITRRRAADGLGAIRSYSAIDGLVKRLLDEKEDTAIRVHVAEVLGRTRNKEACEALKICLAGESGALRATAEEALRILGVLKEGGSGSSLPFKHLSSFPKEKFSTGFLE